MTVIAKWIVQYDIGAKRVCGGNSGSRGNALSCSCSVCLGRSSTRCSRAIGLGCGRGIAVRYLGIVERYSYGGNDACQYYQRG